jgi:hypothetical protein
MSATHKIAPSNPRLSSLLGDVTRGNIKIPVFQREYVWDDEQITSLLDSIYRGYPVGSLLLWSTKEQLKHERNVGGFKLPKVPEDYPVQYLLDGQQRLTTLYGVFNSDAETEDQDLADRFDISFIPTTEDFVHSSVANPASSINLKSMLDTSKLLPELKRFSGADQTKIADATERFKDYEFPVVTIKDRSNQEVCRVFQRINSSGTSLSTLELLSAWTWSEQFDLRNEISALTDRLADKGYDSLGETQILRCLTAIVQRDIDVDFLVDADPAKLISGMATLNETMDAVVDFLEVEIKIKNAIFLPFPIMVVPLVIFFANNLKPSASQRKQLRQWFWHCAFTERYKAGTNTLVREDLQLMLELVAGKNVFDKLDHRVRESVFFASWRINSAVSKAAICMLAQGSPRSFFSGQEIDLGKTLSAYNAREFHHIYPKARLAQMGVAARLANLVANICFLTADDNKAISARDPKDYFAEIPAENRAAILNSALIPASCQSGALTYVKFLEERAKTLTKMASDLIEFGSPKAPSSLAGQ